MQTLLGLAQEIEINAPLAQTQYGTWIMRCKDDSYDESIKEKLDLHHLFPQKRDAYIRSFGIPELIENVIQLSLPGKIRYENGLIETVFFQLTYIPTQWVRIHRCFKKWKNQKSKYISALLQSLLEEMEK